MVVQSQRGKMAFSMVLSVDGCVKGTGARARHPVEWNGWASSSSSWPASPKSLARRRESKLGNSPRLWGEGCDLELFGPKCCSSFSSSISSLNSLSEPPNRSSLLLSRSHGSRLTARGSAQGPRIPDPEQRALPPI